MIIRRGGGGRSLEQYLKAVKPLSPGIFAAVNNSVIFWKIKSFGLKIIF